MPRLGTLSQVFQFGPTNLEEHIDVKAQQLETVSLSSLIKLNVDDAGIVSHSLIVSRCARRPKPGTTEYLGGDVLRSAVASPAVWRKLVLHHGRKVYLDMTNMLDSFCKIPETASSEYHFPYPAGVSADDFYFSEVEPKIFDEAVEMDLSEYCCSRHNRYGLGLITVP